MDVSSLHAELTALRISAAVDLDIAPAPLRDGLLRLHLVHALWHLTYLEHGIAQDLLVTKDEDAACREALRVARRLRGLD